MEMMPIQSFHKNMGQIFFNGVSIKHIGILDDLTEREYIKDGYAIRLLDSNKIADMTIRALCKRYPEVQDLEKVDLGDQEGDAGKIRVSHYDEILGDLSFVLIPKQGSFIIEDIEIFGWELVNG